MSCIFYSWIIYLPCLKGIALLTNHCPYAFQTHTKKSLLPSDDNFHLIKQQRSSTHSSIYSYNNKSMGGKTGAAKAEKKKISPPATYYKAITMHLSNSQPLIHFLFTAREALYKWRTMHKHRTSFSKVTKIRPRRDLKTCFPSSHLAVQFLFFFFS